MLLTNIASAQKPIFNQDDTLRGSRTPERTWWDLTFYDLKVAVNPTEKRIEGSNSIHYTVLKSQKVMQIDLQPPLTINKIVQNNEELSFQKKGMNAYFIDMKTPQYEGKNYELTVFYEGIPKERSEEHTSELQSQ